MENEKISVIMSVYNEKERELKAAIDSILGQTYQNLEFIIVLDNPLNKKLQSVIEDYAEKDSRIRFFINNQNIGLVGSLNNALEYVTGDFIARMDADDISLKTRLADQLDYLKKSNADFVFAGIEYIDEDDKRLLDSLELSENECERLVMKYPGNVTMLRILNDYMGRCKSLEKSSIRYQLRHALNTSKKKYEDTIKQYAGIVLSTLDESEAFINAGKKKVDSVDAGARAAFQEILIKP